MLQIGKWIGYIHLFTAFAFQPIQKIFIIADTAGDCIAAA
jgi:hypothetical protein